MRKTLFFLTAFIALGVVFLTHGNKGSDFWKESNTRTWAKTAIFNHLSDKKHDRIEPEDCTYDKRIL